MPTPPYKNLDSNKPDGATAPGAYSADDLDNVRALRDMGIGGRAAGFAHYRTTGSGPDADRPQYVAWIHSTLQVGVRMKLTWGGSDSREITSCEWEWTNDNGSSWTTMGTAQANTYDASGNVTATTNSGGFVTLLFEVWTKLLRVIVNYATQTYVGDQIAARGGRNVLLNGCFRLNQRAPASSADDTYAHDRWYALTQTGAIAVSTVTDAEDGTPYMARLTQSQASAQRMGYAQIVEGKNCRHLRGKSVTLRFRTRLSTAANIRIAVLEWTGTEDAVTSDVVLDWTSGSYTAGGFFLASNLTVSAVTQQALSANTLTDSTAVTVTLGSSATNLIVLVWTEGAVAQNVTLDLGLVKLEEGSVATPFRWDSLPTLLSECQRYYYRTTGDAAGDKFGPIWASSTTQADMTIQFPVTMRAAPTALEQSGTAGDYSITGTWGSPACSAVPTFVNASRNVGNVRLTVSSGLTAGQTGQGRAVNTSAFFAWSAEL